MAHEAELTPEDVVGVVDGVLPAGVIRGSTLERRALARAAGRKVLEYVEREIAMFDGMNLLTTGPNASAKWILLREAFGLPRKRARRRVR